MAQRELKEWLRENLRLDKLAVGPYVQEYVTDDDPQLTEATYRRLLAEALADVADAYGCVDELLETLAAEPPGMQ